MRRWFGAAGVLALLAAPAWGQAPAPAPEPVAGREPVAPLEIVRSPIRSATVEPGCGLGLLSIWTRAKLPERSDETGQLGFFLRCRVAVGVQLRATMPFVVSRWHSNFESTDHSEWGSPSLELRVQLLRLRGIRLAGYAVGAINWQQRPSVRSEIEVTGLAAPGFAASTVYRGLSIHANAEVNLPFGARNARRTFLIGAAVAYEIVDGVSVHGGYQNAIDLLEDSYWADARAFSIGGRARLGRRVSAEIGLRFAVNPEAELVFNSLGGIATVINLIYEPMAR